MGRKVGDGLPDAGPIEVEAQQDAPQDAGHGRVFLVGKVEGGQRLNQAGRRALGLRRRRISGAGNRR